MRNIDHRILHAESAGPLGRFGSVSVFFCAADVRSSSSDPETECLPRKLPDVMAPKGGGPVALPTRRGGRRFGERRIGACQRPNGANLNASGCVHHEL
jgi:hypothetical protein